MSLCPCVGCHSNTVSTWPIWTAWCANISDPNQPISNSSIYDWCISLHPHPQTQTIKSIIDLHRDLQGHAYDIFLNKSTTCSTRSASVTNHYFQVNRSYDSRVRRKRRSAYICSLYMLIWKLTEVRQNDLWDKRTEMTAQEVMDIIYNQLVAATNY